MSDVEKCPCHSFKVLDAYWTANAAALKPVWDAAVKRPHLSGYQLFMDEALKLCHSWGVLPACPSASGGFNWNCLVPSSVEVPPAGAWIGKAALRWACSGAPDFLCTINPNGAYASLAACQAACVGTVAVGVRAWNGSVYVQGWSVPWSDASGSPPSGSGLTDFLLDLPPNSSLTLVAQDHAGYCFIGWYTPSYSGTFLTASHTLTVVASVATTYVGVYAPTSCPSDCSAMANALTMTVPACTLVWTGLGGPISVQFPSGTISTTRGGGKSCVWTPSVLTVIKSTSPVGWIISGAGGPSCASGQWTVGLGFSLPGIHVGATGSYGLCAHGQAPSGSYLVLSQLGSSGWPASISLA